MIQVREILFDKVRLVAPTIHGHVIEFPHNRIDDFPPYCGAGGGIGNWLVPDVLRGHVRIAVACYIHDVCWQIAEKTMENFIGTNKLFRNNMISIIDAKVNDVQDHLAACQLACVYFGAVQTIGHHIFFRKCEEVV